MNLQDLSPALGVIVLLGKGGKVESLRRFATDLVARSLQRAVVWTDEDLNIIARPDANPVGAVAPNPEFAGEKGAAPAVAPREHTGKYRRLWLWLISQSDSEIQTSFDELAVWDGGGKADSGGGVVIRASSTPTARDAGHSVLVAWVRVGWRRSGGFAAVDGRLCAPLFASHG